MSYTLAPVRAHAGPTARTAARAERLTVPTFALAMLITSYFYCLPLGRFQLAGFGSDFRIYDFAFPLTVLLCWGHITKAIVALGNRGRFFYWARLVVVISWLSLALTAYYGGMDLLLPALVRSYRWAAYLLVPALVFAVAETPKRQRFLLNVFYANILLQAGIAFLQGLHYIPTLWPSYWTTGYNSGGDYPVGTLSLHHKHIGIVMMIGVALSMTLIRMTPRIALKALLAGAMFMMIIVTVFSGIRTAWLGLIVFAVAYFYTHRLRALPAIVAVIVAGGIFWFLVKGQVEDPFMEKLDARFTERVDRFGVAGLTLERTEIYFDDLPSAIEYNPSLIFTGAGFQGISAVTRATAAHNNYLQALFELGILGFLIYMRFLLGISRTLRETMRRATNRFEYAHAKDTSALFVAILATMFVGETLWAQYSMFTLTGQIMIAMSLAVCPLNWAHRRESSVDRNSPAVSQ